MTEEEWLIGDDPTMMLEFVRLRLSARKARLIICEVIRRAKVRGARVRRSIELGERFADGLATGDEVAAFHRATLGNRPGSEWSVLTADPAESIHVSLLSGAQYRRSAPFLLRECVGNPFRPVALDPAWLTSTVVALAEGIYADKAFERMPILADALQDAGCDSADILNHCRGLPSRPLGLAEPGERDSVGEHVRGCWVVDLLLGKQ